MHKTIARTVALSLLTLAQAEAQTNTRQCVQPQDWSTKADAERERVYVNQTDGVYLFEYTPEGTGDTLQGNPFWLSMPAQPGSIYRLKTDVRTGNGTSFLVKINGAVDAAKGTPIQFTLGSSKSRSIDQRVRATAKFVDVYIRGEHVIKFWSFVGPTSLCALKP
jgi:hypothetical protein